MTTVFEVAGDAPPPATDAVLSKTPDRVALQKT
jgi:hypothetical protein